MRYGTSGCGVGWMTGFSGSGACSGRDEGALGGNGDGGVSGGFGITGSGSVGGGLG